MIICQAFLIVGLLGLAAQGASPRVAAVAAVATFIAFWSASQDIAIDAYAVEVLEKDELGVAVGGRVALYRIAMLIAGAVAITFGQRFGWGAVFAGLALLYVPLAVVVIASPEPPDRIRPPSTLRSAVFDPFVSLFRKPRAAEIIAFILLYKLGDNMATALIRPFLIEKGFSPADVGLATATIGLVCTIGGTILGAALTRRIGIGRALWIFGALQALASLGYVAVDRMTASHVAGAASMPLSSRFVMYAAMAFETACQGLATGALDVFLIRLTQKKFSATQYALFASIFALGRTLAGAPAGILVDALGWTPFFVATIGAAVPGLVMLSRFVPIHVREPDFDLEDVHPRGPIGRATLAGAGIATAAAAAGAAVVFSALLDAAKAMRGKAGRPFDLRTPLVRLLSPHDPGQWLGLAGPLVLGLFCGVAVAALLAARRGVRRPA
jgi:PAT family beta-lactamase induction signal transducer AmpG